MGMLEEEPSLRRLLEAVAVAQVVPFKEIYLGAESAKASRNDSSLVIVVVAVLVVSLFVVCCNK